MVRNLLLLSVLAFSVSSFAKTSVEVDPTSALVLSLGSTPAKTAKLMAGANSLKVTASGLETPLVIYTFTARRCDSGVVLICNDLATLDVKATYVNQGERSHYDYSSGPVQAKGTVTSSSNPQGFRCLESINCMPVVAPEAQKYCTSEYTVWARQNCASQPSRLD